MMRLTRGEDRGRLRDGCRYRRRNLALGFSGQFRLWRRFVTLQGLKSCPYGRA